MLYSVFRQMVRMPDFFPVQSDCQTAKSTKIKTSGSRMVHAESTGKSISSKSISIKGIALLLMLIATGCATAPDPVVVEPEPKETPVVVPEPKENPTVVEEPPAKEPVLAQPDNTQTSKPPAEDEMVTVSVYAIDDQCNEFVAEPVQVSSAKAIDEAVGKAITAVDYEAFKLAGYQVSVLDGTAIVDMQLAPGSERKFVSLSSCEQRSLFGSIEETLLNNDWNVKSVKFTSSGKDIIL